MLHRFAKDFLFLPEILHRLTNPNGSVSGPNEFKAPSPQADISPHRTPVREVLCVEAAAREGQCGGAWSLPSPATDSSSWTLDSPTRGRTPNATWATSSAGPDGHGCAVSSSEGFLQVLLRKVRVSAAERRPGACGLIPVRPLPPACRAVRGSRTDIGCLGAGARDATVKWCREQAPSLPAGSPPPGQSS